MSEIPKSIAAALVKAQRAVRPVEKAGRNEHHRYDYAKAEDIIAHARECLTGAGLCASRIGFRYVSAASEADVDVVSVMYLVSHDDGSAVTLGPCESPALAEKGRPEDKASSAALTLNLSYFLIGLLQLERGEGKNDVDARDDSAYEPRRMRGRGPAPRETRATQERPHEGFDEKTGVTVQTPETFDDCRDDVELRVFCQTKAPEIAKLTDKQKQTAVKRCVSAADRCGIDPKDALAWAGLPMEGV